MAMKLRIHQERTVGGATLRIAGSLVAGRQGERLVRTVRQLLRRRVGILTIDLAAVSIMDCSGLGILVRCREAARRRGSSLRLAGTKGAVREMLRMSALSDPPLLLSA